MIAWARNQSLLDSLHSYGINTQVVDLAHTQSLAEHVKQLLTQHPSLSGVIHNAAIQDECELIDSTAERIESEVAINLTAPMMLTQLLLPHLQKQPHAFVCNITSVLALAAKQKSAVYCATKAGLHLFSDSLRAQLQHTSVRVIEVMPPTVDTAMTAHRNVPKMPTKQVAQQTISAIRRGKSTTLLGKGKLFGVLMYVLPPLAKKIMLKF